MNARIPMQADRKPPGEEDAVSTCGQMKLGQVYVCNSCGLELKVVNECDCSEQECGCEAMSCCGAPLQLKA